MEKLIIPLNTSPYERSERKEYGTVRESLANFVAANELKSARVVYANAKNFRNEGKQLLVLFREVPKNKNHKNLKESTTIHVGTTISDKIRSKEYNLSTIFDHPIIEHTNPHPDEDGNDVIYPLVVSPTSGVKEGDQEKLDELYLDADTVVSKPWVDDAPDIDDILDGMVI